MTSRSDFMTTLAPTIPVPTIITAANAAYDVYAELVDVKKVDRPTAAKQALDAALNEARKVAMAVPPKLLAVLQQEIDRSGPEGAVAVCQEQAPVMARNASAASGWGIRRVSLRNRNPKAVPDAWEHAALQDFDRRVAAHEPPARLERHAGEPAQ